MYDDLSISNSIFYSIHSWKVSTALFCFLGFFFQKEVWITDTVAWKRKIVLRNAAHHKSVLLYTFKSRDAYCRCISKCFHLFAIQVWYKPPESEGLWTMLILNIIEMTNNIKYLIHFFPWLASAMMWWTNEAWYFTPH